MLDDGTLADRRGSLNVDDEGNASQRNVLIEDGILKGYIQDSLNARLMKVKPTGNGRRESYAHTPMPRMTNTYMLGGDKAPEEIVASIKKGLYATNFGGGQVDITSGKFVFSASEAFWVENGKILYPVKKEKNLNFFLLRSSYEISLISTDFSFAHLHMLLDKSKN